MKTNLKVLSIAVGISMSALLLSCAQDYDLTKEINTSINIGNNLKIPVGKTDIIYLSRIIKPSDNLTINNSGIYELTTQGNINSNIKEIAPVNIELFKPILEDISIHMEWAPISSITINDKIENISHYNVHTVLPNEIEKVTNISLASANNTPLNTVITLSIPDMPKCVNSIRISNCSFQFPKIINIEGQSSYIVNASTIYFDQQHKSVNIPIVINGLTIPPSEESKYIQTIDGRKTFVLTDDFIIKGDITIQAAPSKITEPNLIIKFGYMVPNTIITKIGGEIKPSVNINEILAVGGISEFIKDDNNTFTPSLIKFGLNIDNPVEMALSANISLNGNKGDKPISTPVIIQLSKIAPKSSSQYIISNISTHVEPGEINIVQPELSNLVKTIPDEYRIQSSNIVAYNSKSTDGINLGIPYNLRGNYTVNIPFDFNNFVLAYTDTIDNLKDDLKDVSNKINKLVVTGTGETTIPADISVAVKLLDIDGNELNELTVDLNKFLMEASDGTTPKESPLQITISEPDGSNQLEQLESLVFTIHGEKLDNVKQISLKANQYLLIKDIKALIPNGITTTL